MDFGGSTGTIALLEPDCPISSATTGAELIGSFLDDQSDLSAVERFARFQSDNRLSPQARRYAALLPATPPGPGQQLAFEVDLDRCSGCKACVTACHNLNGLDDGESWRDVGLFVGATPGLPVLQHVTSACHHCLEPACLSACPVDAYEKDPITGIVRHLDDQCFGCQYCTWACSYGAPKFHRDRGIVRKCDMCHGRLAVGEAPACVGACPHEAIRIRVVDRADVIARHSDASRYPGMPGPGNAMPATRYATSRLSGRETVFTPLDDGPEPEHAHWPLIVMLVLLQLSVGGFTLEYGRAACGQAAATDVRLLFVLCLAACWIGLAASVFHLGRPVYAYRALIGLRHSWLSREVLAFGVYAALATVYAAPAALGLSKRMVVPLAVVGAGVAGIFCSVKVYHAVRRPFWSARYCAFKFVGSALLLGLAASLATCAISGAMNQPGLESAKSFSIGFGVMALSLIGATTAKLWYEARLARRLACSEQSVLRLSARLLEGPLGWPARLRRAFGVVGGMVLPALALAISVDRQHSVAAASAAVLALALSIGGEIAERYLFFAAVVAPKAAGGSLS